MNLTEIFEPKRKRAPARKYKVGDVVVRVKDVGRREEFGTMKGTVTKVVPFKSLGGVKQKVKVKVKWENDAEGLHDDRQLALLSDVE